MILITAAAVTVMVFVFLLCDVRQNEEAVGL